MECLFPRKKRSRDINHRRPSFQHRILDMVSSTGGSSPLNVSSPLSQLKRAESYATIVSTRSTTVPHSHSHSHTATGSASTAVVVPQYSATVGSSTGSRFSVIHVTDTNSAAATISPGRNGLDSTISDVVTKLPARLTQQSSQSHSRPPLPFMMGSHQQQQLQQQQQQNHKRSESVPSRRWSARADAFMQPFAVANDGSTAARDNTEQFIGNADVNESNLTAAAPVPATIVQSATTRTTATATATSSINANHSATLISCWISSPWKVARCICALQVRVAG
ncbi:hypothetical protein GQ42DRAFT_153374 [Ramicandelaber brevisporus]|nr:hypothetical protein GQ42DRAFT_153374 [Ramicandelaber brevisporus]